MSDEAEKRTPPGLLDMVATTIAQSCGMDAGERPFNVVLVAKDVLDALGLEQVGRWSAPTTIYGRAGDFTYGDNPFAGVPVYVLASRVTEAGEG